MNFNIESFLIEEDHQEQKEIYKSDHLDALKKAGFDNLVEKSEELNDEEVAIPFKILGTREIKLIIGFYDTPSQPKTFKGYVPLQVASLLALCTDKDYFNKVEIRSDIASNNTLMSEFVAIGHASDEHYIIARWSVAALVPMEEIAKKAIIKIKKKFISKITSEIEERQKDLTTVDFIVTKYLKGDYVSYYL